MEALDRKAHWENIYGTKTIDQVSWYQPIPQTSLDLIEACQVYKDAAIIDIGGGDSFLVDHLLDLGYTDLTVLDISAAAIERAKERLGERSHYVKWIVADVAQFRPKSQYDIWHDRAAFHFLNITDDIDSYARSVDAGIAPGGSLIIGTFSKDGPTKCSGIEITQYSQEDLAQVFGRHGFSIEQGFNQDHPTPFDTIQNFTFCRFKRT